MKMGNFASLDPAITSTGRRGLANASNADRAVWSEMQADWERFAVEAQQAIAAMGLVTEGEEDDEDGDTRVDYTGGSKSAQVMIRIGQNFFRRAVLSAYDYRCCITGLDTPLLLVASHIIPWRVDTANRLNPRNGLCLSVLHDRAFDAGIITVTENMRVSVSKRHTQNAGHFFESSISAYEGQPITLPEKFLPDQKFLSYHREHVFQT
jgi:predicted restriction endonuclease